MSFWPQQLNFALWCATTGCGISRDILFDKNSSLSLTPQLRSFYLFHVYFTTRRILYRMGGEQSISALPDDPTFNQKDNKYNIVSYKKLCDEFGVDYNADFRFTYGTNNGLGNVYIGVTGEGDISTDYDYPDPNLALFNDERITDKWNDNYKANGISFVRNDDGAVIQYEHFAPNSFQGLTQVGLSHINQSIEAFVYCILGAQVNVRSSILGKGGRAKEAQRVFLTLIEDAAVMNDISKSVQRYQLAIDEAKVRLDFAVAPGTWLMPSRMILNTESTVGYNNMLKQATPGMKLGVNDAVNTGTKKVGFTHMEGGPPKTNRPTSHPSNPIHKAAAAAQSGKSSTPEDPPSESSPVTPPETPKIEPHSVNKTLVAVGALALAGLAVWRR